MQSHNTTVEKISARIKHFHAQQKPFSIYHGSTNSTRPSTKTRSNTVDTSTLTHVLEIDNVRKVALVEPNVPMDKLVQAILPRGLIPPVVMEFPGITVGGGFMGTAGESSSYRHGFFDRTVNWIEIITGDGVVRHASPTENTDLFVGAACSFGTLGVVTLLELQLLDVPPSPVVELEYHPVSSAAHAVQKIREVTSDPKYTYVDGILFSKNSGVICAGSITSAVHPPAQDKLKTLTPTENKVYPITTFSNPSDPWFYLHANEVISQSKTTGIPAKEWIPLAEYLFRYDRGGFWVGKYAFSYFLIPQAKFTRKLLDHISHTRVMYHAVHKAGLFKEYTIQDVAVPYRGAEELLYFVDQSFGRYPLWLCPVKQTTTHATGLLAHPRDLLEVSGQAEPETMLSVGVWGPGPEGKERFLDFNRRLEELVNRLGGQKWLYARTYYTQEEFWGIYPREEMDALRRKYNSAYLPNLYEKVQAGRWDFAGTETIGKRSWISRLTGWIWRRWPIEGIYGLIHTFWGKEYLLDTKR
ncbi:hypothetical protein BDW74DRAFT_160729 [Aspergillus multicolor]|uniref:FAD-binding oxidoreductase n=1 Tax=Aspergillus multicolor TaxID=41759 RepID=UPI003CCCEB13